MELPVKLVAVILMTYPVYIIEGSQLLLVEVRNTLPRVELASLGTPGKKDSGK